jgi:hypothetical protein
VFWEVAVIVFFFLTFVFTELDFLDNKEAKKGISFMKTVDLKLNSLWTGAVISMVVVSMGCAICASLSFLWDTFRDYWQLWAVIVGAIGLFTLWSLLNYWHLKK